MNAEIKELRESLRKRIVGGDVSCLAELAQIGRAQLSQVLNGRRVGTQVKRKLMRHLTTEEMELLGWNETTEVRSGSRIEEFQV